METMLFTALYTELSDHQASLVIRGHNASEVTITTLYESIHGGVYSQDSEGSGDSLPYTVQDGESVTILARRDGDIVASAVFQVATQYIEEGYVLRPISLCHALVDQCDATALACAKDRGMAVLNSDVLLCDIDRVLAEVEAR